MSKIEMCDFSGLSNGDGTCPSYVVDRRGLLSPLESFQWQVQRRELKGKLFLFKKPTLGDKFLGPIKSLINLSSHKRSLEPHSHALTIPSYQCLCSGSGPCTCYPGYSAERERNSLMPSGSALLISFIPIRYLVTTHSFKPPQGEPLYYPVDSFAYIFLNKDALWLVDHRNVKLETFTVHPSQEVLEQI